MSFVSARSCALAILLACAFFAPLSLSLSLSLGMYMWKEAGEEDGSAIFDEFVSAPSDFPQHRPITFLEMGKWGGGGWE